MNDGEPHDGRQFQVGDGRCLCRTVGGGGNGEGRLKTAGDGGGLQVMTRDDTMSSVLVLGSYLSGKFRKWTGRDELPR